MGKQLYTRTVVVDASQVTTGVFDIARIPAAALERMVTVADEATRYALTTATVQTGDTVYQTDTDRMYRVVDDTQLGAAAGYQVYSGAPYWKNIQDNPVTVTATKTLTVTESATLDEAVALSTKANKIFTEIIKTASGSLTSAECQGTLINNYGQAADVALALPAAAVGLGFTVCLATTVAKYFRFTPATGGIIALDGASTGVDKYVQIASAVKYAQIQFYTVQTGATTWEWAAVPIVGNWVQEA